MEERRTFLKRTGLVVLGLAGTAVVGPSLSCAGEKKTSCKPAMIIDVNRCTGCHSCVIACKEQNLTPQGYFNTTIKSVDKGSFPKAWRAYEPDLCHQCDDAPCVEACEPGASIQLDSGIVVVDWEKCTGEGSCVDACPYGARFLDPDHGNKADKCDFCVSRYDVGLEPACVEGCPSQARIFGDLADPKGEFAVYLQKIRSTDPAAVEKNGERLLFIRAEKS